MQATLFGRGEAEVAGFGRAVHTDLGAGAWVEHVPGFVHGQDGLFDAIRRGTGWVSQRRRMYERVVDVPRLLGRPPDLPVLAGAVDALEGRYGWRLDRVSAALYRDGRDSSISPAPRVPGRTCGAAAICPDPGRRAAA